MSNISKSEVVVTTNKIETSFVELKGISSDNCSWTNGFWANKFRVARETMVPYMGDLLCGEIGHALNNFKIAAGEKEGEHKGMFWHDGDFYKYMEAKVYVYAQDKNPNLLKELDEYIRIISKAQEPDGYIQTQVQLRSGVDRYENRKYHEMYNTGHLLITACAHFKITGKSNLLNIAIKQADLLYTLFMPKTKQYGRFGFNQTQIMGLVELYKISRDEKYLNLAERFINNRGEYEVVHHSTTEGYPIGDMVQERTPLRESEEAVGHAVLALYYYAGAADVYAETGEKALIDALDKLWINITDKKMYVTGAVGQAHYGASSNLDMIEEGFIDAYMMPNMTAYNETCANLCNAMFSYRMLNIHGDAKYADIVELVLYNSALSGISIEGKDYFYANPLRMINNTRDYKANENVTETPNREPYLDCFCCPPNLVRTIAKVSGWAYSIAKNGVTINLYGGNSLDTQLADGSRLRLIQETDYPWKGNIKITIQECKETSFDIKLRIPEWSKENTLKINNINSQLDLVPGKFVTIHQEWKEGDVITLDMPMEVTFVEGHPRIEEVRNQVAVKRGPIVYCIETPDLPKESEILDVYIKGNTSFEIKDQPDFLGGVTTLEGDFLLRTDNKGGMYRNITRPSWKPVKCNWFLIFLGVIGGKLR